MLSEQFLTWFKQTLEGADLLHLHNKLYEELLKLFPTKHTEADVEELSKQLKIHCADTKFNKLVLDVFERSTSAFAIKDFIRTVEEEAFSNIPIVSADNVLSDVDTAVKSEAVHNFILLLRFSPELYLKHCAAEYDKLGFKQAYEAFDDFLVESFNKLPINCVENHDPVRLVSLLCQGDESDSNKLCKRKFLTVNFNKDFSSFEELYSSIVRNFAKINGLDVKLTGFDLQDNFVSSVRMMSILAPHWDKINASSMLRNTRLPKVTGLVGGGGYNDSDIVKIMCGRYDLIRDNSSVTGNAISDLIVNHKLFKQYSPSRKAMVCNFLNNNRGRFNNIVKRASANIIGYIRENLSKDGISKSLNNSLSFGAARDVCSDVNVFADQLSNVASNAKIDTLAGAASFICHNYIPMLKQFKERASTKYNAMSYNSSIKQFSNSPSLRIFSVADSISFEDQVEEPVVEYKPREVIREVVREVKVPVTREVKVPIFMSGGATSTFDEIYADEVTPEPKSKLSGAATSAQNLVEQLRNILNGFTTKFTTLYRQLIKNLEGVPLIHASNGSQAAYGLIKQFYDISITSTKTTQYISGVFGDKDYNKHYKRCVNDLIKGIQASGLSGFDSVVSTLQEIVSVLDKVKKDADNFVSEYVNSPKTSAELFTASAKALKIENDLGKEDFTKFNDAIKRLYNSVYQSREQNNELQKRVLNDYTKAVEDRAKVIEEHYKSQNDVILFAYHQNLAELAKRDSSDPELVNDRAILDQKCNAEQAINNRIKEDILYFNKVVEPAILEFRKKIANNALTHEQLEAIGDAWVAFKNTNVDSQDFKQLMINIGKHLNVDRHTVAEYSQLVECLKKLLRKGSYVQFLRILHEKAGINVDNFNWNELEDRMFDIIALKSVKISGVEPKERVINVVKKLFNDTDVYLNFKDDGYTWEKGINTGGAGTHPFMHIGISAANPLVINKDKVLTVNATCVSEESGKIKFVDSAISAHMGDINANTLESELKKYMPNTGVGAGLLNVTPNSSDILRNVHQCIRKFCNYVIMHPNEYNNATHMFENIHNIMKNSLNETYVKEAYNSVFYELCDCKGFELDLVQYIYKALSVDLLGSVDNYLTSRYSGMLALPVGVSTLFKGGNNGEVVKDIKQQGGSFFDIGLEHSFSDANVIADATPFYLIAFNVISYFFNTYLKLGHTDNTLKLKIHKISFLYPLYKMYKRSETKGVLNDLSEMSDSQFRTFVGVCNRIWNNAESGNLDAQLRKSINLLFNELNAGIIYGDSELFSLIESGASQHTIDIANFNKLRTNISGLLENISNAISNTVSASLTPEQNSEVFEHILATDLKKIKETPTQYQLGKLKDLLINEKNDDSFLQDYYKFMELAVVPLLTCANAYNSVFSIFSVAEAKYTDRITEGIDLDQMFMNFPVAGMDGNATEGPFKGCAPLSNYTTTVYKFVTDMKSRPKLMAKYKPQLFEHPIVYEWNRLLLNNALVKFHTSGSFKLPNFWVPIDEDSYPDTNKLEPENGANTTLDNNYIIPASFRLFKQLFPECTGKTLKDFYDYAVVQFTQDCEHFVNAFLSYPGISDRSRKIIADACKSSFFTENSENLKLAFTDEKQQEKFARVRIEKSSSPQQPPIVGLNTIFPYVVEAGQVVDEISVTTNSQYNGKNLCRLGSTNFYVQQQLNDKSPQIGTCNYTWFDWVIINLALCDRTRISIPYKLVQTIQNNSELNLYVKTCTNDINNKGFVRYQQNVNGSYNCLLSQNIFARSILPSNKEGSDYTLLSKSHIANLIGCVPYLISTLHAVNETTEKSVLEGDDKLCNVLQNLIDILKAFYAELSSYSPFIPFLADATQLNTSTTKPHLVAELCDLISTKSAGSMAASDFARMEWANMWFFNNLSALQFPDFKNKDRYEWFKQFAPEIVQNSTYKSIFDQTIQTLGKDAWLALISKTWSESSSIDVSGLKLDEIIKNVINITCECAPQYTQALLDQVIAKYSNKVRLGLSGGNKDDQINIIDSLDPSLEPYRNDINAFTAAINGVKNTTEGRPTPQVELEPQPQPSVTKFGPKGKISGSSQWVAFDNNELNDAIRKIQNNVNGLIDIDIKALVKNTGLLTTAADYNNAPMEEYVKKMDYLKQRAEKIISDTLNHAKNICIDELNNPIDSAKRGNVVGERIKNILEHTNRIVSDQVNEAKADILSYNIDLNAFNDKLTTFDNTLNKTIQAGQYINASSNLGITDGNNINIYTFINANAECKPYFDNLNNLYAHIALLEQYVKRILNKLKKLNYQSTTNDMQFKLKNGINAILDSFVIYKVCDITQHRAPNNFTDITLSSVLSLFITLICNDQNITNGDMELTSPKLYNTILDGATRNNRRFNYLQNNFKLDVDKFNPSGDNNPASAAIHGINSCKLACAATAIFGLNYLRYLQSILANPLFNLYDTDNWLYKLLFYCKIPLTGIKQLFANNTNAMAHGNGDPIAIGYIDNDDNHNCDSYNRGKSYAPGQFEGVTTTICRCVLLRIIANGLYLDTPTVGIPNPDQYKKSIECMITSIKNYIILRLFALRFNAQQSANPTNNGEAKDLINRELKVLEAFRTYGGNSIGIEIGQINNLNTGGGTNVVTALRGVSNNTLTTEVRALHTHQSRTLHDGLSHLGDCSLEKLKAMVLLYFCDSTQVNGNDVDLHCLGAANAPAIAGNDNNLTFGNLAIYAPDGAHGSYTFSNVFRALIYGRIVAVDANGTENDLTKVVLSKNTGAANLFVVIDDANIYDNAGAHTLNSVYVPLSKYLIGINSNIITFDQAAQVYGGNHISLKGGVIRNYDEFIYAFARGVAANPTNRLYYVDRTLEKGNNVNDLIIAQFNFRQFGNNDLTYESLANARDLSYVDPNLVCKAIYLYNPDLIPRDDVINNDPIGTVVNDLRDQFITKYTLPTRITILPNNTGYQVDQTFNNDAAGLQKLQWMALNRLGSATASSIGFTEFCALPVCNPPLNAQRKPYIQNFVHPALDVIENTERHNYSVKAISANDLMFGLELLPYSSVIETSLFSPRKSIYNATVSQNAINNHIIYSAPYARLEYNNFAKCSALIKREDNRINSARSFAAIKAKNSDKFNCNTVVFSTLHNILKAVGPNQFIDNPGFFRTGAVDFGKLNTNAPIEIRYDSAAKTIRFLNNDFGNGRDPNHLTLSADYTAYDNGGNNNVIYRNKNYKFDGTSTITDGQKIAAQYDFNINGGVQDIINHAAEVYEFNTNNTNKDAANQFIKKEHFVETGKFDLNTLRYTHVVTDFLNKIADLTNGMFNHISNAANNQSYGFAFLKGGFNNALPLNTKYFNNNITGTNIKEILGSAYGKRGDQVKFDGARLFNALFNRSRLSGGEDEKQNRIMNMSLAYFKQTPLNISSIYEQVAFPSIIYNTAVYNSFVTSLSNEIDKIGNINPSIHLSSQSNEQMAFISNYIKNIKNFGIDFSNLKYTKQNDITDDHIRQNNYEYTNLKTIDNAGCTNLYTMPSLNNSFLGALARYTWPRYNDFKATRIDSKTAIYRFKPEEQKLLEKTAQFTTPILGSSIEKFVKIFDINTTYLYCVYVLAKQASYYDIDSQTEVPYIDSADVTPFSIKI